MRARVLFVLLAAFCLTPWASPPYALALGALLAVSHEPAFPGVGKKLSKTLLQVSVVLLGFSMELPVVLRAGASGVLFAAATIVITLVLGSFLARLLDIAPRTSALISAGTAICGGSAIAAVGSVISAADGEMTVAMGTVFILNAAALYLFPPLGHALGLGQVQFGTWAGVAIHDISSVVGASSRYGMVALQTATAVKLSRALWIVPLALAAALMFRRERARDDERKDGGGARGNGAGANVPWFIGLFLLASVCRSFLPWVAALAPALSTIARTGFTLTLFLIGASLSLSALRSVGWKPLAQGVALWLFVSTASLFVILKTVAKTP